MPSSNDFTGGVAMKSETLRNIKTMRQVKTSLEVARHHELKTTNKLYKTAEEIEELESMSLEDKQIAQILAREKARAAKFEASVDKSQRKLLASRKKLAVVINRNRALTELRHEIQMQRDQMKNPQPNPLLTLKAEKIKQGKLVGLELKY
jgi:hypothetical protein